MSLQVANAILARPGHPPSIARDAEPTLAALRHAERTAYMELCRAYADLADIPPRGRDAIWNARERVTRRTRIWVTASEAYFAALAASIEGEI